MDTPFLDVLKIAKPFGCMIAAVAAISLQAQPANMHARALADSAYVYVDSEPDKAVAFAQQAIPLARKVHDLSSLHDALNTIRYAHFLHGEHAKLIDVSAEALKVATEMGSERAIGDDHGWIAMALTATGQVDEGFRRATIALEHMRRSNDKNALARGLCDLSVCAVEAKRHGEAILRVSEAENIYEELGDSAGMAFSEGLVAGIYMKQDRYGSAMPYLTKAYRFTSKRGDDIEKLWLECDLARASAHLRLWDNSEYFLKLAEAHLNSTGAFRERPALLQARIELLEQRGELAQALALSQSLITLTDSMAKAEVVEHVATSSNTQEVAEARKEHDRLAVRLEEMELAEKRGSYARTLYIVGGVLCALLIACLVYALIRSNRRQAFTRVELEQALDQVDVLRGHKAA